MTFNSNKHGYDFAMKKIMQNRRLISLSMTPYWFYNLCSTSCILNFELCSREILNCLNVIKAISLLD